MRLAPQLVCTLVGLSCSGTPTSAQLRPYSPADWEILTGPARHLELGAHWLEGQKASLAGEEGSLIDIGIRGSIRIGGIVIAAEGVPFRRFRADSRFADPYGSAQDDGDGIRRDVGDFQIATMVPLTTPEAGLPLLLRFGTRLPTTDNRVGLERDQTDFFATLASRVAAGPAQLTAEAGVGIHGTREPAFEQSDVLVFSLGLGAPGVPGRPQIDLAGHADGLSGRSIRGNEELAELRFRVRSPGPRWLSLQLIKGLLAFSPRWGAGITAGTRW